MTISGFVDARTTTARVLAYLDRSGPATAGEVGSAVWTDRRGRIASTRGGGDYAALMLLGRLRRRGLVVPVYGDIGSTLWRLTDAGIKEVKAVRQMDVNGD